MTAIRPPHLLGNYAPVTDELTANDFPVASSIPPELGMVHGVRSENGKAKAYRNRWVRTKSGRQRDERGNLDLTVSVANTHVVRHA